MDFFKITKIIFSSALSSLLPNHCALCASMLENKSQTLCLDCVKSLPFRHNDNYNYCSRCARICDDDVFYCCEKDNFYFDKVLSLTHYHEDVEYLIHQMKFSGRYRLCYDFASMLMRYYKDYILSHDILIAVPLASKRFRERGYNQSSLIAKRIFQKLSIEYSDNIVVRRKQTAKLSKTHSAQERKSIIENAFAVNEKMISKIEKRKILIIDDVFTTGATVNEMAKAIKSSCDVLSVSVLTVSHT